MHITDDDRRRGNVNIALHPAGFLQNRIEYDGKHAVRRDNDKRREPQPHHAQHEFPRKPLKLQPHFESFGKREEQHRPQRGQKLRNYGRDRRALHAHAERENEQRVENDVGHRADNHGHHRSAGKALRGYETVKPHGQQCEHAAEDVNSHIVARIYDRVVARAEREQKLPLKNQKPGGKKRRNRNEHYEAIEKYTFAGLAIALAHFHGEQRRSAQAHKVTERRNQRYDRTAYADPRQREIAVGHFADENPVDYTVQHVHKLREHGRYRKPQYQRKHFVFSEIVRSFHTFFVFVLKQD